MIIAIQGTRKKKNNSIGTTALLSSMTSILYNAKTLVLQLSNPKELHVDEALDKEHLGFKTKSDNYEFNTSGIDSLLMECADKKELRKGLIAEKSEVFIKADGEPLLVVTRSSENKEFEDVAVEDFNALDTLLDSANKEYEYVFVLMPRNKVLASYILSKAQFNIICIPQSDKVDVLSFESPSVQEYIKDDTTMPHKDIYVIADFEEGSRFTQKKIRSDYNIKKTFVAYHNIDYSDAYLSKEILSFVKKNIDVDSEYDSNFMFVSEIKRLIAEYALEELDEHYDDLTFASDYLDTFELSKEVSPEMRDVTEYDVEFTKKRGRFGKTVPDINVTPIGGYEEPASNISEEDYVEPTPIKVDEEVVGKTEEIPEEIVILDEDEEDEDFDYIDIPKNEFSNEGE